MKDSGPALVRQRLYALFEALEIDLRDVLERWASPQMSSEEMFGPYLQPLLERVAKESRPESSPPRLLDYLHLSEEIALFHIHEQRFPSDITAHFRSTARLLEELVPIRNRVMHIRPLLMDDPETVLRVAAVIGSNPGPWTRTAKVIARLANEPEWAPLIDLPASAPDRVLHNLPLPDFDETGLVGRGDEQRELRKLVLDGRQPVVTVVGEGGVGKTALAVSTLYSLLDDPECTFEAILWTSLKTEVLTAVGVAQLAAAARDALGIAQALGDPLGVDFLETASQLGEVLAGIPTLVVIDNLETVDASELISLFDALPNTSQMLLTSRVGLGQLERRFPLSPLRRKDAQHLLRALARKRGLQVIATLADSEMAGIADALRSNPLAVKWFVLAVEAGGQPEHLLRHQEQLLEFCMRSIHDSLTEGAKKLLELLFGVARPAGFGELVVLSGLQVDETRMALHELQRSSLLELDTAGGSNLALLYGLSSTAYQFIEQVQPVSISTLDGIHQRDSQLRRSEERRRLDEEQRGLAPQSVRLRSDADEPVAHLLREALWNSKRGDLDSARELILQAEALAPDYFEAPRVRAFIESQAGNTAAATQQYEKALRLAPDASRPVIEFFFAGHLARVGHDTHRALPLAQAAHQALSQPDTANLLGQIYMYLGQYNVAEDYLSEAASGASGKLVCRLQNGFTTVDLLDD